jgi:hypothetical protein
MTLARLALSRRSSGLKLWHTHFFSCTLDSAPYTVHWDNTKNYAFFLCLLQGTRTSSNNKVPNDRVHNHKVSYYKVPNYKVPN